MASLRGACTLALVCGALGSAVLRVSERAVVSDARQSLDGTSWQVSNGSTTFPGTVPGDLITDMENAKLIGDPLYELNFKSQVRSVRWLARPSRCPL